MADETLHLILPDEPDREGDVFTTEDIAKIFDVDPDTLQAMKEARDIENEFIRRRQKVFFDHVIRPNLEEGDD